MALPTSTTLPAAPAMLGADDAARQEYFTALQKTLGALEARANQGPNWFQVAGALLDPGRTGNVGEAIGRTANVLGAQQQRQQEMELPIAQVRAQLAGQKYEVENQAKALQVMSGIMGVPPAEVGQALQSGNLAPASMTKLMQAYPIIAQLSPKVGEIVKGTFTMQNELTKQAQEDRKAGYTEAEMVAKYGPGIVNLIPGRTQQPAPAGAPAPQPGPAAMPAQPIAEPQPAQSAAPTPSPYETEALKQKDAQLRQQLRNTDPTDTTRISLLNTELDGVQKRLKQLGIATPAITQAQPQAPSDTSGLPLAAQAEVGKKRVEESDKPYNLRRDEILTYTPQLLEGSNTNLRQLDYFARTKPQIFALMQQQGLLSGLMTAAQEGAQLNVGDFQARLGLPVRQFLEKVKLAPEDQQAVRDVTRILGAEFLSNVRANKGLLGINPTDNDARLLQAPMASIEDSSKAVQLWARQQILLNKQREALYGAWSSYADQTGAAASPRNFFKPGSVYEKINKDYADYRMQLFKQFHSE